MRAKVRNRALLTIGKIRYCYSHDAQIMSGKSFICYALTFPSIYLPSWLEAGAGSCKNKETLLVFENSASLLIQSSFSIVAFGLWSSVFCHCHVI